MTARELWRRLAKEIKAKNGNAQVKLLCASGEEISLHFAGSTNEEYAQAVFLQAKAEKGEPPEPAKIWRYVSDN